MEAFSNVYGAENQSLASLFQSSFDPATMLLDNSEMKSEIEIIGKETINGVQTIGLSVQMDADSLQHVIEPMIESAAGDASDFVTSIAGEFLNNIEREYWIGEDDKLIHAMKLHLSTPFGDFNLNVTVYDYNESFEIPVNAEQITEN